MSAAHPLATAQSWQDPQVARWTLDDVRAIAPAPMHLAPLMRAGDVTRIGPDLDIWDAWPVREPGGMPIALAGGSQLWMALGAPHFSDPDERHGHARIHCCEGPPAAGIIAARPCPKASRPAAANGRARP